MTGDAYEAEANNDQEHWLITLVLQSPHCVTLGSSLYFSVPCIVFNNRVILNLKINMCKVHGTEHGMFYVLNKYMPHFVKPRCRYFAFIISLSLQKFVLKTIFFRQSIY